MPWTREERLRYQARWRARNPTYQRDHKAYRRTVEGQWRAEFMAKTKKHKTMKSLAAATVRYPWED